MSKIKVFLLLVLTVLSFTGYSAICPIIKKSPAIDGNLNEAVWQKAFKSKYLVNFNGIGKAKPQTRFYMYSDGEKLYIAIIAKNLDVKSLSKKKTLRDNIDWNETLEVFFAPDVNSTLYFHFAFTPSGGFYDNIAQANATDNNYSVEHKSRFENDTWILEAAFPLKELEIKKSLQSGDEFDLNVTRTTSGKHQCWSPTGSSFHNRRSFKQVIVGSYAAFAKLQVGKIKKILEKIKSKKFGTQLKYLEKKAASISSKNDFIKFNKSKKRLLEQIKQTLYSNRKLILAQISPWTLSINSPLQSFSDKTNVLNLSAIKGEVLDIALSVINPSSKDVRFRCVTYGLLEKDSGTKLPVTDVIKTYNAVTAGIKGGTTQRDALVEVGKEHPIHLSSLKDEVIWLRVDTSKLTGGNWRGKISFIPLANHKLKNDILLNIQVFPAEFPKTGKPYSCNWARYNSLATGGRMKKAAFADQRFNSTNVHILLPGDAGFTTVNFDETGKPLNSPDFSRLDEFIDAFGNDTQLYVFTERYAGIPKEFGGSNNFSSQSKANLKWYIDKLHKHLSQRGLTPHDIAWYSVDEPDLLRAKKAIKFYKLLLDVAPKQQIFCTIYGGTPVDVIEILCPYVNIWVAGFNTKKHQLDVLRTKTVRKPIRWFSYLVLSRTTPPSVYRLTGLRALLYNYEGIGFWAYDDAGRENRSSTWNDFDSERSDYAVVYEGNERPQPSVRWRAWHQTIQSYRYVEWLRKLARECNNKKLVAKTKELIKRAILNSIGSRDQDTADYYTGEMRTMALKLLQANGKIDKSVISNINTPKEYCLTGNSQIVPPYDTKGSYSYKYSPKWRKERCGVMKGEIYFKGKNAKGGLQFKNGKDGTLTDKSTAYPSSWIFWRQSPTLYTITFDFKKSYVFSKALLCIDFNPNLKIYKSIATYVSNDKKNWRKISSMELTPISKVKLSQENLFEIDLYKTKGRYVAFQLKAYSPGGKLGEVYILGYPLNSETKK